uniref:AlNc14C326G10641 protein n=1 Tax=Albugo laibachii Nc14 TaxID=890382 RepID=F0WWM8_9STRA|nr:AlNc14C326G10641 [Albugo laibachii Nc14]|eukprot:CCA25853.1 AlNc14C326G10641 [Albugo laibachii Nc14]
MLGDHQRSREYCERLLRLDPANARGRALYECVDGTDTSPENDVMGVGIMVLAFALVVATVAFQILKHH